MATAQLESIADNWAVDTSVRLTQSMVRTDSTCGREGPLARQLEEELKALDLGKVWCEEVGEDRFNTLLQVDSGKPGPHLLFTGHLDTKPVCEGWTRDPFDAAVEDGRLFGHAVMDMKAGLGCQVGAIKSLVDGKVDFNGRITFAAVCDHMGQQSGSIDLFRRHEFDHCVLGELTGMQIYIAHRGRYYFDISTVGRSAHTCHKDLAINAIEKMLPVADEIAKLRYHPDIPQSIKDLVGPELYIAVGRIFGGLFPGGPSMIPDRCTIRVDTRPQPGVPLEEVQGVIEEAIRRARARDDEIRVELDVADEKNSYMIEPDAPIVAHLRAAWEEVMGKPAPMVGGSWLGDTASFGHLCETVIFGPGGEPVYQPDESIALSDLEAATKINALTAARLLQPA